MAGPPDAKQIDTWLAIHADNTATVYVGFAELGQGTSTALLQIASDELDLEMGQIKSVRLDTNVTPNQGGTYSSASIARGGPQVRQAAAEARRALLGMASKRLNAPAESLRVSKGVVSTADGAKRVTYGELIGDRRFDLPFSDTAPVKQPADYKVVGTRVARRDLPDKVSGQHIYMQHVRVPGMLHGRVVRPRGQRAYGVGARVAGVDETSIRGIAGARVLRRGDFVGVVAENEWDAVRAARQLKVTWEPTTALPGSDNVYERMRAAKTPEEIVLERGNVATAFPSATHVVSQVGRAPYQAHAPFGPNCAVADVKARLGAGDVLHAGRVRDAPHACDAAQAAAGDRARPVLRRLGHLRPQLLRRCGAGGGVHVAGGGTARARAVHAVGRARVGQLRARRTSAKCGRPSMPAARSSRTNIRAGSMAGAARKPRRNSRARRSASSLRLRRWACRA